MAANSFFYRVRQIVLLVVPPVLILASRKIRGLDTGQGNRNPHYSEYSTLQDPLEVPSQVESYLYFRDKYIQPTDHILEVGFGLGYGMQIMASKAASVIGVEVDPASVARAQRIFDGHPLVTSVSLYDGKKLPFADNSFDVVTCLEVIEHVEDYNGLLLELERVAKRIVFITTPNRRPEHTLPNGKPTNYWHLREWSYEELNKIITDLGFRSEWNLLNGPLSGPYTWSAEVRSDTQALAPVIVVAQK